MYYDSPHAKYEMGKEAFIAEQRRWNSLSDEERVKEREEIMANAQKHFDKLAEKKKQEQEERSLKTAEHAYVYTDTVNTMENSEATIIWIVVMLVGAIFVDRLTIWVTSTAIWLCFINRYKIRKKKWDAHVKAERGKNMENGGNK